MPAEQWSEQFKNLDSNEIVARLQKGLIPDADTAAREELKSRGIAPPPPVDAEDDNDAIPAIQSRGSRVVWGLVLFCGGVVLADAIGLGALPKAALAAPGALMLCYRYPFEKIPGFTKLMYYASKGSVAGMVRQQAEGDSIDARDSKGGTALMYAARNGHANSVEWLLRSGADASRQLPNGDDAAAIAEKYKHPDISRLIRGSLK